MDIITVYRNNRWSRDIYYYLITRVMTILIIILASPHLLQYDRYVFGCHYLSIGCNRCLAVSYVCFKVHINYHGTYFGETLSV